MILKIIFLGIALYLIYIFIKAINIIPRILETIEALRKEKDKRYQNKKRLSKTFKEHKTRLNYNDVI